MKTDKFIQNIYANFCERLKKKMKTKFKTYICVSFVEKRKV